MSLFIAELEYGNSIRNGLFKTLSAVFVDLSLILFSVSKASGSADTAADARHTLDKVGIEQILRLLEQSDLALLDTVAGTRLKLKIGIAVLAQALCDSIRQTAAAGKNSAVVGGIIKNTILERGDVDTY